jgi:hypothetical protein
MENLFEKITEIKKKESDFATLIKEIEKHPHLCFCAAPVFHENGRMRTGTIARLDLPTDLGINEAVMAILEKERLRYEKEFLSYKINK